MSKRKLDKVDMLLVDHFFILQMRKLSLCSRFAQRWRQGSKETEPRLGGRGHPTCWWPQYQKGGALQGSQAQREVFGPRHLARGVQGAEMCSPSLPARPRPSPSATRWPCLLPSVWTGGVGRQGATRTARRPGLFSFPLQAAGRCRQLPLAHLLLLASQGPKLR